MKCANVHGSRKPRIYEWNMHCTYYVSTSCSIHACITQGLVVSFPYGLLKRYHRTHMRKIEIPKALFRTVTGIRKMLCQSVLVSSDGTDPQWRVSHSLFCTSEAATVTWPNRYNTHYGNVRINAMNGTTSATWVVSFHNKSLMDTFFGLHLCLQLVIHIVMNPIYSLVIETWVVVSVECFFERVRPIPNRSGQNRCFSADEIAQQIGYVSCSDNSFSFATRKLFLLNVHPITLFHNKWTL